MKNTRYFVLVFNMLMTLILNAQINTSTSDLAAVNEETGPLSISPIFESKDSSFEFRVPSFAFLGDSLQAPNAQLETQNPKRETQNLKLETQNPKLEILNPKYFVFNTLNANTNYSNANRFKLIEFFQGSETFDKKRFWGFVGASSTFYVGTVLLLDKVWYAQYPRSAFHLFNDDGEWQQMDKGGHVLTAYTETKWIYQAMRWTGMQNNRAAWAGMATGTTLQLTLEVLDGFSTEWGFSWGDMAANTAGCALFGVQQAAWNEQRIVLKVSNTPRKYSNAPIRSTDGSKTSSLKERTDDLYGINYAQTFFKDYNALTWWLSVNPRSFDKNSRFPSWLNVAIGMGADNMFGGYKNEWPTKKPEFILTDVPRYRQFYVSLDIDLSKIKTKSKFLNTIFRTINFIKIPAPALEFNTLGQVKFHPLFF